MSVRNCEILVKCEIRNCNGIRYRLDVWVNSTYLLDAHLLSLGARGLELLALAEVGGEGDHLAAVGILEPLEDDGGVEAAGVREHDLFRGGARGGTGGSGPATTKRRRFRVTAMGRMEPRNEGYRV